MADQIVEKRYTVDDLWELSHRTEERLELVNGEIRRMSPAGGEHGALALRVGARIIIFVEINQLGFAVGAETGFILAEGVVRAPDVGFIAKGRLEALPRKYIPLAPDLAVEIISPSETISEIEEKRHDYLRYGVRQVWEVYPNAQKVHVYQGDSSAIIYTVDMVIPGGDVLPGFELAVREIFV